MVAKNIVVASVSHETNTFSPIATPLHQFGNGQGPLKGNAAYEAFRGTGTATGGLIELAERVGARVHVPIVARCLPSTSVDDEAYRQISDAVCAGVAKAHAAGECDALFLELHGAMVTQSLEDGDGPLLQRLRKLFPDLPIALSLDFHANITDEMVSTPTSVVAYKTFPHLDMKETGIKTGEITLDAMAGKIKPCRVWGNIPLLVHLQRMNTSEPPLKDLFDSVHAAEAEPGVLAVSVLAGFPLADTREAGLSCIVITDGDEALGKRIRDRILAQAWENRAAYTIEPEPLNTSVAYAKSLDDGPWLLLDVADTCNSGGTLDSVSLLREMRKQGLTDVAAAPLCDPMAVQEMLAAGVGAEIEIDLGEKVPTPSINGEKEPLRLKGRVAAIHDGDITVQGPVFTGTKLNLGPTVLFETNDMQIVVTSNRAEPYDPGIFRCVGVNPEEKRYIVLKSRMQCKPAFLPFSKGYVDCNGIGVTTSDYSAFDYKRLRRPIYPFDTDATWEPEKL